MARGLFYLPAKVFLVQLVAVIFQLSTNVPACTFECSCFKNYAFSQGMDFCLNGKRFAVFNYTLKAPADRTPLHDTFVIETDFERT